jgi:RHS repeat-associated protein
MVEEINGPTTTAHHFHYDGNGNVTETTDLNGNPTATYRYDAFGNTLLATGTYAANNRYRFSTKPLDSEVTNAPLYYYSYRYYDPVTGRWPSRDPIEEEGGINLYGFVGNDGVNAWDVYGLFMGAGNSYAFGCKPNSRRATIDEIDVDVTVHSAAPAHGALEGIPGFWDDLLGGKIPKIRLMVMSANISAKGSFKIKCQICVCNDDHKLSWLAEFWEWRDTIERKIDVNIVNQQLNVPVTVSPHKVVTAVNLVRNALKGKSLVLDYTNAKVMAAEICGILD